MALALRTIRAADKLLHERWANFSLRGTRRDPHVASRQLRLEKVYQRIMPAYLPPCVAANVLCLIAASRGRNIYFAGDVWRHFAPRLDIETVPGEHLTCVTTHAEALAVRLFAQFSVVRLTPPVRYWFI